ncbi:hypothetical protein BJ742DRAFT_801575 [Cladochytrium replicatum]|nr:hypothetical protein BJ742DRAFT_801575 [Cladochytrium replicatum]
MNASIVSPTPTFHRTQSCPTAVPEPSTSPFQQLHTPTAAAMMMKLRQTSASPVLSEHGGSIVLSPFMSDYQPTPTTTVGDNDVLLSPPIPWTFPTSLSSSPLAAEYPFGLLGTPQQDNGHFLDAMMSSTVAPESSNSLATQDPCEWLFKSASSSIMSPQQLNDALMMNGGVTSPIATAMAADPAALISPHDLSTPSITPLTSPSPIAEEISAAQAAAFTPEVPAEWMLPSLWYGAMQQASAASFLEQAAAASMYRGFPPAALNPFLHRRPVHAYPPLFRSICQGSMPAMMLSEKDRRSLNASPSLDTKPLITLAAPLDTAAATPLAQRIPPQATPVAAQKRKRAAESVPQHPVKLQRTDDGSALPPPPSEVSCTSPDIKPVMIDEATAVAGSGSGSSSKKPVRLSKRNFDILMRWLMEHSTDPFPDKDTKETLMNQVGLSKDKLEEWFINARRRYLKRIKVRAGVYMYEPKEGKAIELLDDCME